MLSDELGQLPDDLRVAAEGEVCIDPLLDRGQAKLLEPSDRSCGARQGRDMPRPLRVGRRPCCLTTPAARRAPHLNPGGRARR